MSAPRPPKGAGDFSPGEQAIARQAGPRHLPTHFVWTAFSGGAIIGGRGCFAKLRPSDGLALGVENFSNETTERAVPAAGAWGETIMSEGEDILSRQRRKAAAYSLASELLSEGNAPAHIECRLVNEGWSTKEAHDIVSALQAASQRAENVLRGRDEDGRPIEYPDNQDSCRPPTSATPVKCQRCGQEYESSRIEARLEGAADGRPLWCCPIPGCNGRGFGFNILPVNRHYHNEEGDWDPLVVYYPDSSRHHQVH